MRPRRRARWSPLVFAVAAVALGGCGGGSKTTHTSTRVTLSKAAFLKRANGICQRGQQLMNRSANGLFGNRHPTPKAVAVFARGTVVPEVQSEIDVIRAIGAETADDAQVEHMLDLAQGDLNRIKSSPTLLANPGSHPFKDFAAVAHPYGLTSCARDD